MMMICAHNEAGGMQRTQLVVILWKFLDIYINSALALAMKYLLLTIIRPKSQINPVFMALSLLYCIFSQSKQPLQGVTQRNLYMSFLNGRERVQHEIALKDKIKSPGALIC